MAIRPNATPANVGSNTPSSDLPTPAAEHDLEVLRIIVAIGGVETNRFSLWHDKAGSAVAQPCEFLHGELPDGSIVRPTLDANGGAVATVDGFIADRLFEGQSAKFIRTLRQLAREADAAQRNAG